MPLKKNPTASIIIIGNEILSGRTLDTNTQAIAQSLAKKGVDLIETRTIADDKNMIIETVRLLSSKYDYVFTTGGIGPTHDDITSISIAEAFNLKYSRSQEIYDVMKKHYEKLGQEITPAREKMAFIPEGAKLLYNDATVIPGFVTENVFSMAGIPGIMKSMLETALPMIKTGNVVKSESIELMIAESDIARPLEDLQIKYPSVDMGSYPFKRDGEHGTALVLRSSNYNDLEKAFKELKEKVEE